MEKKWFIRALKIRNLKFERQNSCELKFIAQFVASEFECHLRAYLAPHWLFSLLFTTRGFMPNSDHSIRLHNLASFQVRQIRQSTPACHRERTQSVIWSLYIPACFEWFSFSFICQRAVYRRTRWNVQAAAIVFPAYTRNQNGRKVDIANRRKTVPKARIRPRRPGVCFCTRGICKKAGREGCRIAAELGLED